MLVRRIREYLEPMLRSGESIEVAMAGFRPISRSSALLAIFPSIFLGIAASTAGGWSAGIGGGVGGGLGVGLAAWLDQRRARGEHGGKGMSIGLVVTGERLFVLDLATGPVRATVAGVDVEVDRGFIQSVETKRMQGSGLKRLGVVIGLRDGSTLSVIPARSEPFLAVLEA